jgi:hypothetical protein
MCNFFLPLFFLILLTGCKTDTSVNRTWTVTHIGNLPEAVSNQAVSEGFVNEVPYLYSFGGIDSTRLFSGIHLRSYRIDLRTGITERIEDIPDTLGKIAAAASRINDTIYVIGGYHVFEDSSEKSSDRVHRFHISQNRFLEDGAKVPVPIDDQVQAVYKNRYIYLITGWSDTENVASVQVYDALQNRWLEGTSVPNTNSFKSFGASGSIVGDTIYYLGGASMGPNFPIQAVLRKGLINPKDPVDIEWTAHRLDSHIVGYRMGSFARKGKVFWIGGSNTTYNYNAMAYDGTGGVEPNRRILTFDGKNFTEEFNKIIPMDLRGIANIDDSLKYVAGGITDAQRSSQEIIKLEWKE